MSNLVFHARRSLPCYRFVTHLSWMSLRQEQACVSQPLVSSSRSCRVLFHVCSNVGCRPCRCVRNSSADTRADRHTDTRQRTDGRAVGRGAVRANAPRVIV